MISRKDQDLGRGVALMVAGAVMVLLEWVVPTVAPLALAAYAIYRLFMRNFPEGGVALLIAVGLWFLSPVIGWMLWLFGLGMAGCGLFFLIRGIRGQYMIE